jgi:hypothetical protein
MLLAGAILLLESIFGCYAVLGIGFSSLRDVATDLCLTLAFPIYLLSIFSIRIATIGLWLFFAAQWINMCLVSRPPTLISPLDGVHGDFLFLAIVLVTFADFRRLSNSAQIDQTSAE